jgi:DNA-directed RNA polymerase specialized sigma24 family protein
LRKNGSIGPANTAQGIVQNAEDAEDIAQELFVQVYKSINSFNGGSKFSTSLCRITITKAPDHERRKRQIRPGIPGFIQFYRMQDGKR